jgi:hypothetical protein
VIPFARADGLNAVNEHDTCWDEIPKVERDDVEPGAPPSSVERSLVGFSMSVIFFVAIP